MSDNSGCQMKFHQKQQCKPLTSSEELCNMKLEEDFESSDENENDCPEDTPVCEVRLCERSTESPRTFTSRMTNLETVVIITIIDFESLSSHASVWKQTRDDQHPIHGLTARSGLQKKM